MKRLLFVSNLFPDLHEPYRGLDNATILHALSDRWEIAVLSPRPTLPWQRREYRPREVDHHLAPRFLPVPYLPRIGSRINHRLMARALRPALREARPFDLVLGSWLYPDGCAIAQLAREEGFPFVNIAQGSDVHQYLRDPVRRRLIVAASTEARAVITRSAELARLLREAGVPAEKPRPIYNGTDPEIFRPASRDGAREALGWEVKGGIILFIGNLVLIKNPALLIEALAHVRQEPGCETTRLVLAGGGPLEASLRADAARRGLGAAVLFVGRQEAPGIARLLQAADVLALPSQNEGVPNVILEAFSCGRPVVASRVGGISEVHVGAALGQLCPAGNALALAQALRSVLREPPPEAPIVAHSRQFTWARTAEQYDALLRQALRA